MAALVFLIEALAMVISTLLSVYFFIVVGACLISWVNPDPYNPIVRILRNLTEPVLWRIRKYLPFTYIGGLDFSPVVLLVTVQIVNMGVSRLFGAIVYSLARG